MITTKKLLFLIVFVIGLNTIVYAAPAIKGQSAILASATGEQVIFDKNPGDKVYPAGLTKLFTALVAYEIIGMDTVVAVPENIKDLTSPLEPSLNLKPNEQIKSGDLIAAMIVGSANDVAIVLAIFCSESTDNFVIQMNEKAKKMNLKNTQFTNVTGTHDENQFTTALDMLAIFREIYKTQPLMDILNSRNIIIPPTNTSPKKILWTNNHLLSRYLETKYIYQYAKGGKTTSSSAGGYSVAVTAKKGNSEFICIVFNSILDQDVNYSLVDAKNLFEYGFNDFAIKNIVKQDELVYEVKVKNSASDRHLVLYTANALKGLILKDDNIGSIEKKMNVPSIISAPVKKGDIIGNIEYSYLGKTIGRVNLLASADLNINIVKYFFNSILWFLNIKIVKTILILLVLAVVIYLSVVIYAISKAKNKK